MKGSSRPQNGRTNQKARTRAALVEAASALLRGGKPPTVAEAADEARVSRATAYRYFPTQEALLIEVADLEPAMRPVEELLAGMKSEDVEQRMLQLVDVFNGIVFQEEVLMRNVIQIYMDTWLESRRKGIEVPSVREGRRMRWLDQALAPVRAEMTEEQWRRLRSALALVVGLEALIVVKDVCRLADDEAFAMLRWAASTLLRAGLAEARVSSRALPAAPGEAAAARTARKERPVEARAARTARKERPVEARAARTARKERPVQAAPARTAPLAGSKEAPVKPRRRNPAS